MGQEEGYDVAVIGAGVAGALIGWQLARAGARVVILEAGPRVDRAGVVARHRASVVKAPGALYPAPAGAPRYVQAGPEPFKSTYLRCVGGTTWHWLGTAVRLLPSDFAMRSRYGVGVDWPLCYQELEPWYVAAERELGVAGDDAADLGSPRSAPYPLPAIPLSSVDRALERAAAALGWRLVATPQARNSMPYEGRPQCCGSGTCVPICPIGAKYDATVHVARAEAAGARILENAVVYRLDADACGTITAARYKTPTGARRAVTARVFVAAANAIETAKLLLMSRDARFPRGLANASGQVGRNLADHPIKLSIARAKEPVDPYRAPQSTAAVEQLREGDHRRSRSGFRLEVGNDGWA